MVARSNRQRSAQAPKTPRGERGNFVSEWYGHRVYPIVAGGRPVLADQKQSRCPFLSRATVQETTCVKPPNSTGVCTISSSSNGPRQDWLVCPHRVLGSALLDTAAARLFGARPESQLRTFAAPTLAQRETRSAIDVMLRNGDSVVVYLRNRLGGEISVSQTDRSPEFSFDITMVELTLESGAPKLGRFGVLEVQTMDFHGTYQRAVQNLQHALRLHDRKFHAMVSTNQRWLSDRVEGPNIANVFKRTFYQMLLKFQIGADEGSAGCVLALPAAVWDSWQRHLGETGTRNTRGRRVFPPEAWRAVAGSCAGLDLCFRYQCCCRSEPERDHPQSGDRDGRRVVCVLRHQSRARGGHRRARCGSHSVACDTPSSARLLA